MGYFRLKYAKHGITIQKTSMLNFGKQVGAGIQTQVTEIRTNMQFHSLRTDSSGSYLAMLDKYFFVLGAGIVAQASQAENWRPLF